MPAGKLRVTLLSEMLQPYRIPVFNEIASRSDVDLSVLLLSLREPNRKWEVSLEACRFDCQVLPFKDVYIHALDWGLHFNWGVRKALRDTGPEVIAGTGYVSPAYLIAQRYARQNRLGYVLWSGSTARSSRIGKGPIRWMKQRFIRRCDACLSYGTEATRCLELLGADPARIITGCNTVDIGHFERMAHEAAEAPSYAGWRSKYPRRLVLFVGHMIERKGVMDLVEGFRKVGNPDLGLVIVGDGPEWGKYQEAAVGIPNLFWEGYVQSRDMGPYLAAADALVMPSHIEVWGLVINEAMAASVPVIATRSSGAAVDLIEEGRTGRTFEAGDVEGLSCILRSVAEEPEVWREMGERALARVQSCGPAQYAESFIQACRMAARVCGRIPHD
jgi:glycosyltransferase involved in cell wall biosynthesis